MYASLLVVFLVSCATKPLIAPVKEAVVSTPLAYTGIQLSAQLLRFTPPLKGNIEEGIRIENIMPGSPASRSELQVGDIILEEKDPRELGRKFVTMPVGTEFKLKVLSGTTLKEVSFKSSTREVYQGTVEYKEKAKLWEISPQKSYLKQIFGSAKEPKLEETFEELSSKGDALRPKALRFIQENPLSTHEIAQGFLSRLQKCTGDVSCLEILDLNKNKKISKIALKGTSFEAHTQFIEKVLLETQRIQRLAFTQLSTKEKKYLEANVDELSNRFIETLYAHEDSFLGRKSRFYELTRIIDRVDISKFQESIVFLGKHLNENYFLKLKNDLKNLKGIKYKNTAIGKILIADSSDHKHSDSVASDKIALLIDLGGDDVYQDISGMISDLSGNDHYESSRPWTLGAAKMDTGFFMDLSGDDRYMCEINCLGSSFLGAALFIDKEGNDIYNTQVYSQGTTFTGVSLFIDGKGDDQYLSFGFSQGVAIAGGLGILLDLSGNDRYLSRGMRPSAYQDAGQFESWSQGVGIGLRFFVSGGTGILYDKSGKDSFESGTFSLGGGYAFGLGVFVNDGEENDTYKAMRYGQGFAAHGAAGIFIESGGNDQYFNMSGVCESLAWDLSVSYLEDKAGNDSHLTGGHCLGAASHSSYAFFFDRKGKDTYRGKELPISTPVPSDYHNTPSLAYFLDSGSEEDNYEVFKNNTCQKRADTQIICDE